MRLKLSLHISKKTVILALAILVLAGSGIVFYVNQNKKTPLPSDLKDHVKFKAIYPMSKNSQVDTKSFVYQSKNKILSFDVHFASTKIVFTEQQAPESLGSDTQAYYPALGIHPYAQFKTSLGQVALTKFWQSGNLKPVGQSAVLASNNTFLIAHSEKNLTNAQWKDLFESLKTSK
jgi:hypothetical protein